MSLHRIQSLEFILKRRKIYVEVKVTQLRFNFKFRILNYKLSSN